MIPRFAPTHGGAELLATMLPAPPWSLEKFEELGARTLGHAHGIVFPYGRTAIMMLLEAMGVRDREVLCPAYTCVVVPHAIVRSGNEPVFVDCEPDGFNMDLDAAEAAITERTAAIMATSIFGYPVDLDRLDALRARHPELLVIQDCAHSFRASWNGRDVSTAGDAAIVGLNVSKIVTSVFGGLVTTDDAALAARVHEVRAKRLRPSGLLRSLRRRLYWLAATTALREPVFGVVDRLARSGVLDRFVKYYDEETIDLPADHLEQVSGYEARVGAIQTTRYDAIVERRRSLAARYDELLQGVAGLERPPLVEGATYSHYVPRTSRRGEVVEFARKRGVQLGILIEYSVPHMKAYRNRDGVRGDYPRSDEFSRTCLNLSVCTSESGAARIAQVVREALA